MKDIDRIAENLEAVRESLNDWDNPINAVTNINRRAKERAQKGAGK